MYSFYYTIGLRVIRRRGLAYKSAVYYEFCYVIGLRVIRLRGLAY